MPGHAVLDLTAGRNISRDLSVSITALNVANRHLLAARRVPESYDEV